MKKIAVLVLSVIISGSFAQSISLVSPTFTFQGADTLPELDANITVYNSNTDLNVRCQRMWEDTAPGHTSQFCWGNKSVKLCYADQTELSPAPGLFCLGKDTMIAFQSHLKPNGKTGITTIHYCLFPGPGNLAAAGTDTTCFTLQYNITAPNGINELSKKMTMSVPNPNPADQLTTIGFSLNELSPNSSIEIYNLLGASMASYKIEDKNGVLVIPTSHLATGTYLASFKQNNEVVFSQKLIVSHKN